MAPHSSPRRPPARQPTKNARPGRAASPRSRDPGTSTSAVLAPAAQTAFDLLTRNSNSGLSTTWNSRGSSSGLEAPVQSLERAFGSPLETADVETQRSKADDRPKLAGLTPADIDRIAASAVTFRPRINETHAGGAVDEHVHTYMRYYGVVHTEVYCKLEESDCPVSIEALLQRTSETLFQECRSVRRLDKEGSGLQHSPADLNTPRPSHANDANPGSGAQPSGDGDDLLDSQVTRRGPHDAEGGTASFRRWDALGSIDEPESGRSQRMSPAERALSSAPPSVGPRKPPSPGNLFRSARARPADGRASGAPHAPRSIKSPDETARQRCAPVRLMGVDRDAAVLELSKLRRQVVSWMKRHEAVYGKAPSPEDAKSINPEIYGKFERMMTLQQLIRRAPR